MSAARYPANRPNPNKNSFGNSGGIRDAIKLAKNTKMPVAIPRIII